MSVHINHCTAFLTTFIYISVYFSCRHVLQSPYISGCPFLAQDYPIKTRILSVSGANLNSVTYFFRIANNLTILFSMSSQILFQKMKKWADDSGFHFTSTVCFDILLPLGKYVLSLEDCCRISEDYHLVVYTYEPYREIRMGFWESLL